MKFEMSHEYHESAKTAKSTGDFSWFSSSTGSGSTASTSTSTFVDDKDVDILIETIEKIQLSIPSENNASGTTSDDNQRGEIQKHTERIELKPIKQAEKYLSDVEKGWAKKLYEMDAKEREDIQEEVHGISSSRFATEESPEIVSEAIVSFREYLKSTINDPVDNGKSVAPVTKEAFRKAVALPPSRDIPGDHNYVMSDAFLLKFLRAESFDNSKAALRLYRNLDLLYTFFDVDGLERPIAISDLRKMDLAYLRNGCYQIYPSRDSSGRRIMAYVGKEPKNTTVREKYRVLIYLSQVVSEDELTQKLGLVAVVSPRFEKNDDYDEEAVRELLGGINEAQMHQKINEGGVVRVSAYHHFGPDSVSYRCARAIALAVMTDSEKKMVRFHAGSLMECTYSMQSFGIPSSECPLTDSGNIKNHNVNYFIKARKAIEGHVISPGVECPTPNCILLGSKHLYNAPANVEFRAMLMEMYSVWEESKVNAKSTTHQNKPLRPVEFMETVVEQARSRGFCFRKLDKKTRVWIEVDDREELCKKVSQFMRDERKRILVQKDKQNNDRILEDPISVSSLDVPKRRRTGTNYSCLCL